MAAYPFSVIPSSRDGVEPDSALVEQARTAVAGSGRRWAVSTSGSWCSLSLPGHDTPAQGWKLHVSATPASAPQVLAEALPVLLADPAGCPFKFVADVTQVAVLNARHTARGHSGKFLTVYPRDDADAVRLAQALDEATAGLPGPRILSDRPYRPGSLVHYRYGAFVEQRRLSHDGFYSWVVLDPEGNPVEDLRTGRYTPPSWARCPFPDHSAAPAAAPRPDGRILLDDRFLVTEAIRHTNRGGVYRAVDTRTDAPVLIKEARPHVGADEHGRDERDRLRTEARVLRRLEALDVATHLVAEFEQAQHAFLAESLVPGVPLRQWVQDRVRESGWRRGDPGALDMALRLARLLDRVHEAGAVLRDFTPNNIMVRPDDTLRLIDLELAVFADESAEWTGGTPGYAAPEQVAGAAPAGAADRYSLGATVCFLALGTVPLPLEEDEPRPHRQRVAEWLALRWPGTGLPDALRVLVADLLHEDPERRPSPRQAATALEAMLRAERRRAPRNQADAASAPRMSLPEDDRRQAVEGIVGHLVATMKPGDPERLWPISCAYGAPDPATVQHGAAGPLAVLTRYARTTGADLRAPLASIAEWIGHRLHPAPVASGFTRPPGLYFGTAGIAWALAEAGWALGDDKLVDRGLGLAASLPDSAVNPDLTHGTAGIGLTLFHLARRSGDPGLLAHAVRATDAAVAAAEEGPTGLSWGTPAEHHSMLAGRRYHGFAHGAAGVGYLLLVAAQATGRQDCLELARRTGETLVAHAALDGELALWGAGTDDPPTAPHWCHGGSGIGTFLVRLAAVTGEPVFAKFAEMAGRAVVENAGRGVLAQCHGVSGNGEFLLDLAEATGDPRWRVHAHRLARLLFAERARRGGRLVFPDEQHGVGVSWGDGMSGMLSFLLRLRHGGPRMWMLDELLGWEAAS